MKIVTYNICHLNSAIKKGFYAYMNKWDIVCLQETKENIKGLPKFPGYYNIINSSSVKNYAGTAIISKYKPINVEYYPTERFEHEGRHILAQFETFNLINVYAYNAKHNCSRLAVKLDSIGSMLNTWGHKLKNKKTIIVGDWNICQEPEDLELWRQIQ